RFVGIRYLDRRAIRRYRRMAWSQTRVVSRGENSLAVFLITASGLLYGVDQSDAGDGAVARGARSSFGEVHSRRAVKIVSGHGNDAFFITSDRRQDVDDVQWITGAQLGASVRQADFPQVLAAIALQNDVPAGCHPPEDLIEGMLMHGLDED